MRTFFPTYTTLVESQFANHSEINDEITKNSK